MYGKGCTLGGGGEKGVYFEPDPQVDAVRRLPAANHEQVRKFGLYQRCGAGRYGTRTKHHQQASPAHRSKQTSICYGTLLLGIEALQALKGLQVE